MKKTIIAFDCDWTLIETWYLANGLAYIIKPNERIVELLKILSSFKNTKIIVWSGQWENWARTVVRYLWIKDHVNWYASKNHKWKDKNWKHIFDPDFKPDIAIDDIQACELWLLNLIVREK